MKAAAGVQCVMEDWSELLESWLLGPAAGRLRTLHPPALSYSQQSPSPLGCCFGFDYGDPPPLLLLSH